MGGDHAPTPEIEGAVAAVRDFAAHVILVGDEARIREHLRKLGASDLAIDVRHTSEVITMNDPPGAAVKTKKDSSMRVAFELAKRGDAAAVVSAGNSGAMLACGLLVMKRLPGVDRPGIVTTFPTRDGACALIDMGANVECKPQTLTQFAVLGAVYAKLLHKKERPRVGVLSNGSEPTKGTDLTRETHRLLAQVTVEKDFEYIGYVEGRDIFVGGVDVVVTDGFTGNIVLKTAEGAGSAVIDLIRREVFASPLGKLGALLLRSAFGRVRAKVDADEHGGAPLVGVDGVAILCHGGSSAKAIKNGIRTAALFADADLPRAIATATSRHAALWRSAPADVAS